MDESEQTASRLEAELAEERRLERFAFELALGVEPNELVAPALPPQEAASWQLRTGPPSRVTEVLGSSDETDRAVLRAVTGSVVSSLTPEQWALTASSLRMAPPTTVMRVSRPPQSSLPTVARLKAEEARAEPSQTLNASDRDWLESDENLWQEQFAHAYGAAAGAASTVAQRFRPAVKGGATDPPSERAATAVAEATADVIARLLSDPDVITQVRDSVKARLSSGST
jgi:hypothetical protein